MYFVFLFVEGPLAHTGQLMLRERQQKKPTWDITDLLLQLEYRFHPLRARLTTQSRARDGLLKLLKDNF